MNPTEILKQWNEQFSGIKKLNLVEVKNIYQKIETTDNEKLKEQYLEKIILGTQHVVYNYLKKSGIYLLSSKEFHTEDIISSTYEAWIENIKTEKVKDTSSFSRITQTKTFSDLVIKKIGSISKEKILFGSLTQYDKYDFMYGLTDQELEDNFVRYYNMKKDKKDLSHNEKIAIFNNPYFKGRNNIKNQFINLFDQMYDYLECTLDDINISDTNLKKYIKLIVNNTMTEELTDDYIDNNSLDKIIFEQDRNNLLLEAMKELTEQEKNVIRLRYGFDDGYSKTVEEVGKIYNVTREKIRQYEWDSIEKIKKLPSTEKLKDYCH